MSVWSPRQQVLRLARSLRRARSIELPNDNEKAARVLLELVVANQYSSLADLLADSKFDVSYAFGRVKKTLLHIAANCGHFDCLIVLLRKGCNPDIQDISGSTALHLAARNGQKRCVEKLLESEANPDIAGNDGATALHWLAVNGRVEILKILLQYTSSINLEDGQGHTALHAAARNGHTKAMECLIEAGADINYSNSSGITPLHSACTNGQRHAITLLLSKGVHLGANCEGQTPIDLCMIGGYGVATELLLMHSSKLMKEFVQKSIYNLNINSLKVNNCMKYFANRPLRKQIALMVASITSDIGFQLLSLHCDKDEIISNLSRSSLFLCSLSSPTEPRFEDDFGSVFDTLDNLWQSVADWLILLNEDIACKESAGKGVGTSELQEDDKVSDGEVKCNEGDKDSVLSKMAERISALTALLYKCFECQKKSGVSIASRFFHDFISQHIKVYQKIVLMNPKVIFNHFSFCLITHL